MKKMLAGMALLTFAPLTMAEEIYLFDQGPGSIYLTGGGGTAWMLNEDWELHTSDASAGDLKQPENNSPNLGTINGAFGYEFDTLPVRMELAYRWFNTAVYDWDQLYENTASQTARGEVESQAGLFNMYLDWRNSTGFLPYIGGGVGVYFNRSHFKRHDLAVPGNSTAEEFAHDNSGLAWSASAGFRYYIGPGWFLDIRGEYTDLGIVDFYEDNLGTAISPGERELIKTERYSAISALANLTYVYSLDQ